MSTPSSTDVAVVTGAGRGIGRAVASDLARQGMMVVASDLPDSGVDETVEEIVGSGHRAIAVHADITVSEQVGNLAARVVRDHGVPRVLVNNAGWTLVTPFLETDEAFRRRILEINLLGPISVTFVFAKEMVDSGVVDGRVIFVSSDAGRVGSKGEAVYSSAKGGLISLAKSLAREFARHGITCNAVAPGPIDTRLYQQLSDRRKEALLRGIPLRRVGLPADVAGAVSYLAKRETSYVTGQVFSVSGGLTMAG